MLKIPVCRANKLPQQEMERGSLEVGTGRDKQSFNNYLQSSNPTLERLAAIEVGHLITWWLLDSTFLRLRGLNY